ncbi:2,4-dienoyl-CoA reductase [Raineyella antarctica]|uniref:2,4-dienoyl-CoA reductase n=1 Tax=Raineyella antarctica TaxID=1577474 RepID=A0A1G6HM09_9ACTN|nr:alkene reductase [Raineyella antarctica]SDB95158.1 2,4-dienoyl-CoA reductase [Raineyella antarctica]
MTELFDPIDAGDLHLRNRVTIGAMTRQRAAEDGVPNDLLVEYYAQRASAGLVVTEGTFPSFRSRGFMGAAGIADQQQADGWRRVADAVHARGGTLVIQVMHAGRMAHPGLTRGEQPEAPSAIAAGVPVRTPEGKADAPVPHALDAEDLMRVRDEFVTAARRAIDAGVDGVELHGANGYLLHEFLSPASNTRTDQYGGSPENRARFVVEVMRAVAAEISAGRVGLRISPEHNIQGVLEQDRTDVLATYDALLAGLRGLGTAYLSVLHKDIDGDLVRHLREGYDGGAFLLNSGFSAVTDNEQARHIVEDGLADAVTVGRAFIANPDLVERWHDSLAENVPDMATFYLGGAHGYTDYAVAAAS